MLAIEDAKLRNLTLKLNKSVEENALLVQSNADLEMELQRTKSEI